MLDKKLFIFLILILNACSVPATPERWSACEKVCATNGGIEYWKCSFMDECICKNGAKISVYDLDELH